MKYWVNTNKWLARQESYCKRPREGEGDPFMALLWNVFRVHRTVIKFVSTTIMAELRELVGA